MSRSAAHVVRLRMTCCADVHSTAQPSLHQALVAASKNALKKPLWGEPVVDPAKHLLVLMDTKMPIGVWTRPNGGPEYRHSGSGTGRQRPRPRALRLSIAVLITDEAPFPHVKDGKAGIFLPEIPDDLLAS